MNAIQDRVAQRRQKSSRREQANAERAQRCAIRRQGRRARRRGRLRFEQTEGSLVLTVPPRPASNMVAMLFAVMTFSVGLIWKSSDLLLTLFVYILFFGMGLGALLLAEVMGEGIFLSKYIRVSRDGHWVITLFGARLTLQQGRLVSVAEPGRRVAARYGGKSFAYTAMIHSSPSSALLSFSWWDTPEDGTRNSGARRYSGLGDEDVAVLQAVCDSIGTPLVFEKRPEVVDQEAAAWVSRQVWIILQAAAAAAFFSFLWWLTA